VPRSIVKCPERPQGANPWKDYETLTCTVEVVTPLFGGGVEAGRPDPVTLIRPSSIRGHLRFWWRATRGAACNSAEGLRRREILIWGSTDQQSRVFVAVELVKPGKRVPCAKYSWNPRARGGKGGHQLRWEDRFRGTALPYALFPFQGKPPKDKDKQSAPPEEEPADMVVGLSFRLTLRYPPECRDDVRRAAGAWLNFGGVGARTRRGCGSLYCADFAPRESDPQSLKKWLRTTFPDVPAAASQSNPWPMLLETILVGKPGRDPLAAWNAAMDVLQRFRQGPGVGRNPGRSPNRPGRSRWPEPETIRKTTLARAPIHSAFKHHLDGVPRVLFGAPIVFHFKDERSGDPPDTEVYPVVNGEAAQRMGSPLILKPWVISPNAAVPLILRLRTPPPDGAELRQGDKSLRRFGPGEIAGSHLANYSGSPMDGHDNAVDAFIAFAKKPENGFEEVL